MEIVWEFQLKEISARKAAHNDEPKQSDNDESLVRTTVTFNNI